MLRNIIYRHLRKAYPNRPSWWADRMAAHYVILCEQKMSDRDYERYNSYKLKGADWMFYKCSLEQLKLKEV